MYPSTIGTTYVLYAPESINKSVSLATTYEDNTGALCMNSELKFIVSKTASTHFYLDSFPVNAASTKNSGVSLGSIPIWSLARRSMKFEAYSQLTTFPWDKKLPISAPSTPLGAKKSSNWILLSSLIAKSCEFCKTKNEQIMKDKHTIFFSWTFRADLL